MREVVQTFNDSLCATPFSPGIHVSPYRINSHPHNCLVWTLALAKMLYPMIVQERKAVIKHKEKQGSERLTTTNPQIHSSPNITPLQLLRGGGGRTYPHTVSHIDIPILDQDPSANPTMVDSVVQVRPCQPRRGHPAYSNHHRRPRCRHKQRRWPRCVFPSNAHPSSWGHVPHHVRAYPCIFSLVESLLVSIREYRSLAWPPMT